MNRQDLGLTLALLLLGAPTAQATWSIVVTDPVTKEVGIASVTCLDSFDLRAITPVVRVGIGAAAVQAAGDFDGVRRPIIHDELLAGTAPVDILAILAGVFGHQQRQYGIVDTQGRPVTFTGSMNGLWAEGVQGDDGVFVHAIQGNVLAGACVVADTETAFLAETGDLAEKLMVAMEAARDAGGDGRCSCNAGNPTGCSCPVVGKSGHIGYLIVVRIGDVDDPTCDAAGCADGDYFLNLNFPFQPVAALDPVDQMRAAFDDWRLQRTGRPDAIRTQVTIRPTGPDHEMEILVRDWQDDPPSVDPITVRVEHESDSAGIALIGTATDQGGSRFIVSLTTSPGTGLDRYRVTVDDGLRTVVLMPSPELCLGDPCVCNPGDPTNDVPAPASALTVAPDGELSWTEGARSFGSELHGGLISELRLDDGSRNATCLASDLSEPLHLDGRGLPSGDGYFYLAAGVNACGPASVGADSLGRERTVLGCP